MLEIATSASIKWRLPELETILDEFDNDLCITVKNICLESNNDYPNLVLYASGKSIVTFREVIRLCAFGYPDGALSLARNIYEQLVIICFFEQKKNSPIFQNYITDYYLDYDIQRCKALIYEYEHFEGNTKRLEECTQTLKKCEEQASRNTKGKYWWAGYPTFEKIAESVSNGQDEDIRSFLQLLHYTYKRASVSLHSSCLGNAIRLGNDKNYVGVNTAPSLKGQDIPLWFATASFIMVVGVACQVFNIDFENYKNRLNDIAVFYRKEGEKEATHV